MKHLAAITTEEVAGESARELTDEVTSYVGKDIGFTYRTPLLAGGMESTPSQFATFLRKVISGQLRLKQFLGYQPVCTQCADPARRARCRPAREPAQRAPASPTATANVKKTAPTSAGRSSSRGGTGGI